MSCRYFLMKRLFFPGKVNMRHIKCSCSSVSRGSFLTRAQRRGSLLCRCPWSWSRTRQQHRSCPKCLRILTLTAVSAAGGRLTACVTSFRLNHRDIIWACLPENTNWRRFILDEDKQQCSLFVYGPAPGISQCSMPLLVTWPGLLFLESIWNVRKSFRPFSIPPDCCHWGCISAARTDRPFAAEKAIKTPEILQLRNWQWNQSMCDDT